MSTYSLGFDIFARDEASAKFDKLGKKVEDTGNLFTKHKAVIASAAAGAGLAVVAFGKQAIDAASDQNEVMSKSKVIFGNAANAVEAWAGTAATSMGMSKTAALTAASSFGDMFSQLGFAGDEAVKMSQKVVQMSADLGSFSNLPTAEVADMMSAAFRGEYDSLQRLIPNINAARVESEALAMTHKKSAKELTAQEKAAATLSIVMKDGSRATGDFARTSDGLANSQRILAAKFDNAQASLGQKMLPAMTAVVKAATALVDVSVTLVTAVGNIPGPVLAAVAGLTAFHLLKGPLSAMGSAVKSTLGGLREALLYAGQASERAGGGLKGLSAGFRTFTGSGGAVSMLKSGLGGIVSLLGGPWGIALMGATTAVTLFAQAQANAKGDADSLRDSIDKQTGAWTALSREKIAEKLAFDVNPADIAMLEKLGVNMQALNDAVLTGGPAYNDIYQQLINIGVASSTAAGPAEGLRNAMDAQRAAAERARGEFVSTNKLLGDTGTTAATVGPQMSGLATKIDSVGTSAEDAKRKAQDLANALLGITDATVDSDRAQVAYSQALASSKKALEENGKGLSLSTEAGQKNRIVLADLRDKALAMMDANLKNGASVATVGRQMTTSRADFVKLATQMNGGNKAAAEALADKYGLTRDRVNQMSSAMNNVPKKVVSTLTLVGYIDATARQILGATATAASKQRSIMADRPGRARGGEVYPGVLYAVGENPDGSWNNTTELFEPDTPGTIHSAADSRRIMSRTGGAAVAGGGETTIAPLHVEIGGETLVKILLKIKRNQGGVELGIA